MKRALILGLMVVAAISTIAAHVNDSSHAFLQSREFAKWDAVNAGKSPDLAVFDPGFISIGYGGDGRVYLTRLADWKSSAVALPKPPAPFALSDVQFVDVDADTMILTYRVHGPLELHATSIWSKRGGEWRTVFYQATRIPTTS